MWLNPLHACGRPFETCACPPEAQGRPAFRALALELEQTKLRLKETLMAIDIEAIINSNPHAITTTVLRDETEVVIMTAEKFEEIKMSEWYDGYDEAQAEA